MSTAATPFVFPAFTYPDDDGPGQAGIDGRPSPPVEEFDPATRAHLALIGQIERLRLEIVRLRVEVRALRDPGREQVRDRIITA